MAGIGKCMGIMGGGSFLVGAATTYILNRKANDAIIERSPKKPNGKIPIGGMTPDGKLWDGEISPEDYKKQLDKRAKINALVSGGITAIGTAIVSALTLLLRGKVK